MGTSKPPFSGQFSNVAALLFHIARNVAPPVLPDTLSQVRMLQCVVVCCNATPPVLPDRTLWQADVAVCCSVLQRSAACPA